MILSSLHGFHESSEWRGGEAVRPELAPRSRLRWLLLFVCGDWRKSGDTMIGEAVKDVLRAGSAVVTVVLMARRLLLPGERLERDGEARRAYEEYRDADVRHIQPRAVGGCIAGGSPGLGCPVCWLEQ